MIFNDVRWCQDFKTNLARDIIKDHVLNLASFEIKHHKII